MFHNFINLRDFADLFRLGCKGAAKLFLKKSQKVKAAWSHISAAPVHWWDIPAVQARWNYLISGDSSIDYYEYVSQKFLRKQYPLTALSLGCGTGKRELKWAKAAEFTNIDAYDLSEDRIREAAKIAAQNKLNNIITYHVGDVYKISLPAGHYDVVFAEQSLHHFSPLREMMLMVSRCLKPAGYFILNEFAGPTRFQWTDRQLQIVNGLLAVLPKKYRMFYDTYSFKSKVFRPSRLRMVLGDPSEAVESSKIMPLLHETFEVINIKEYGGTVLHLLFNKIAHNFITEDDETRKWLQMCFDVEDMAMKAGEIRSDFFVAVCRKRADCSCLKNEKVHLPECNSW